MILKDKFKKQLQHTKTYQVTPKTILRFKTDTDPETLLSIIPKTQYTSHRYINFNRQMLNTSQERIFNKKFTNYMHNLLPYKDTVWFEHLLDFLIQTFIIENFNTKELIFLILTDKKYDEQIRFLSCKITWLKDYVWSYTYFASNLMNEAFFDFFMEYFEFYGFVKNFLRNVLYEFSKIGNYEKINDRVLHLLETLKMHDAELYEEIYEKIRYCLDDTIEIEIEKSKDLHNAINIKYNTDPLNILKLYNSKYLLEISDNCHEAKDEQNIELHNTKRDKENNDCFMKTTDGITEKNYINTELKDVVLKENEYKKVKLENNIDSKKHKVDKLEIINKIKFEDEENKFKKEILSDFRKINNENINQVIDIYKTLQKRDKITQFLLDNFKNFVVGHLNEAEIVQHSKKIMIEDLDAILLNSPNTKLMALNKKFVKQNIKTILSKIILLKNIDMKIVADFIRKDDILNFDMHDEVIFNNIIQISEYKNYDITEYIMENKIYNDSSLRYLIDHLENKEIVWPVLKNYNNQYLLSYYIQVLNTENMNETFLKDIIMIYTEKNIRIDKIAKIMENYIEIHDFVKDFLVSIVTKDKKGEHIKMHELYMKYNNQYIEELLSSNNLDILKALIRYTNIFESISRDCFSKNYQILFDALLTVQPYKNETILLNINSYLKMYVENSESCKDMDARICENRVFYIGLISHFEYPHVQMLIFNYIDEMLLYHNEIFEALIFNVIRFFEICYPVFDIIKEKVVIDFSKILASIPTNYAFSDNGVISINKFVMYSLKKEFHILPHVDTIIKYCDELTAYSLLRLYCNMMIPYLEIIIQNFLHISRIQKELLKINAIEVIKILTKYTSDNEKMEFLKIFLLDIKKEDSSIVVNYLIKNIERFYDIDLLSAIIVFFAKNNVSDKIIHKILDNFSITDIYNILCPAIQHRASYFESYIYDCVNEMSNYSCITEYFRHSKNDGSKNELCDKVYNKFLSNIEEKNFLVCFASVLNYMDVQEKTYEVNNLLLKKIKDEEDIECFELLNMLYEHAIVFKQCITVSATYFGIFLDHRNKEIVENTKKLLENIAAITGENPYEYF